MQHASLARPGGRGAGRLCAAGENAATLRGGRPRLTEPLCLKGSAQAALTDGCQTSDFDHWLVEEGESRASPYTSRDSPPSIQTGVPVMWPARGEARNRTSSATWALSPGLSPVSGILPSGNSTRTSAFSVSRG